MTSLGTLGILCKQQWEILGGFVKGSLGKRVGISEKIKKVKWLMPIAKKDMQFHFHAKKNLFAFMLLLTSWPTNWIIWKRNLKTFESQSWTFFSCIQITSCVSPKMIHNNCMQTEWFLHGMILLNKMATNWMVWILVFIPFSFWFFVTLFS